MIKFLIIIFAISIFAGCSSSETDNRDLFYINFINSTEFPNYYWISAQSNSKFYDILSKKENIGPCNNLKERTYYKFHLDTINTPIKTDINSQKKNIVVYIGDKKFYENGQIVGKIYSSPDLKGLCITNPNIFHYP